MRRKFALSFFVLLAGCVFLFAQTTDRWLNSSCLYTYAGNTDSSSSQYMGFDISGYAYFPGNAGLFSAAQVAFATEGDDDTIRFLFSFGPAYTSVVTGGVNVFADAGPAFTFTGPADSDATETQIGLFAELGFRFRVSAWTGGDMAFVAGMRGAGYFYHMHDSIRRHDFSGDITGYAGVSFGADAPRYRTVGYGQAYTLY